jgi:hypothetical protein
MTDCIQTLVTHFARDVGAAIQDAADVALFSSSFSNRIEIEKKKTRKKVLFLVFFFFWRGLKVASKNDDRGGQHREA